MLCRLCLLRSCELLCIAYVLHMYCLIGCFKLVARPGYPTSSHCWTSNSYQLHFCDRLNSSPVSLCQFARQGYELDPSEWTPRANLEEVEALEVWLNRNKQTPSGKSPSKVMLLFSIPMLFMTLNQGPFGSFLTNVIGTAIMSRHYLLCLVPDHVCHL